MLLLQSVIDKNLPIFEAARIQLTQNVEMGLWVDRDADADADADVVANDGDE